MDLVVVAASQGGLAAYRQIVAGLPAGFPAAVIQATGRLQQAGLIRYRRGIITVVDRQGLEAACECYRIVSDEYIRLLGARVG